MKVVISSGHGKYIRGASGYIDEVDEARLVVEEAATALRAMGVQVTTYHDDVSDDQSENLDRIVDFHNAQGSHDLDVSIHFNSTGEGMRQDPIGCEVFYTSDDGMEYADEVVDRICAASGLKNRGPKESNSLAFLNNTNETAILVEVCFVDSRADCNIYEDKFEAICGAIAAGIAGRDSVPGPVPPERPERPEGPEPPEGALFVATGTCSWFGGPNDDGVSSSEGLAFIYEFEEAPYLFLEDQPPGTSGLARRLDPGVFYIACRWDYDVTSKTMLRDSGQMALVTNKSSGVSRLAHPADWGPHEEQTGRAADLSPGLMENLDLATDDLVDVVYPYVP
jgi:N-acetylmuramoyl-L-alanine amidase